MAHTDLFLSPHTPVSINIALVLLGGRAPARRAGLEGARLGGTGSRGGGRPTGAYLRGEAVEDVGLAAAMEAHTDLFSSFNTLVALNVAPVLRTGGAPRTVSTVASGGDHERARPRRARRTR